MTYLIIDAVSEPARLMIADDKNVLTEATIAPRNRLAENLLSTVDGLLSAQNLTTGVLTRIGIVNEPASFTSLRLSISVGNALAYSLGIPLVSLETADLVSNPVLLKKMKTASAESRLLPKYGRAPTITRSR